MNRVCDTVHGGCVSPEQLGACRNAEPQSDCSAGEIDGACFDGVCLPRGCGNRVVEPDEACDDGNVVSSDGCRSDCRSNETCGNNVLDSGEQCDDGNLLSRDDCDSRCLIETVGWRTVALTTAITTAAYDESRQRLVVPRVFATWELVQRRWHVVPHAARQPGLVTYDTVRGQVVAVSIDNGALAVAAWDGATWTPVSTTNPPSSTSLYAVTYDPGKQRLVAVLYQAAIDATVAFALDLQGKWVPSGSLDRGRVTSVSMAMDASTSETVVHLRRVGLTAADEYVFDGANWPRTSLPAQESSLMTYRGELRAISGPTAPQMFVRRNRVWVRVANEDPPAMYRIGFHDLETNTLVLHDGTSSVELDVGGWLASTLLAPTSNWVFPTAGGFQFVHQPLTDDSNFSDLHVALDGELQLTLGSGLMGRERPIFGYSSVRGGVLANGEILDYCDADACYYASVNDTGANGGGGWTTIESVPDLTNATNGTTVYDPSERRLLVLAASGTWQLPDDFDGWSVSAMLAPMPQVVWDARNARLVGYDGGSKRLYEADGTSWVEAELYPESPDRLLHDERTGGVLLLTRNNDDRVLWERRGVQWTKVGALPHGFELAAYSYRPDDGTLLLRGDLNGDVVLFRERSSATPLETCEAGSDVDGDGRSFCDDPDCYWRCSRCPPYTQCRFDLVP